VLDLVLWLSAAMLAKRGLQVTAAGSCSGCVRWVFMWGLTFELRRDRRQDARPGPVKMYAYHRPGPGGLPLGLASNEGLGVTGEARSIFIPCLAEA